MGQAYDQLSFEERCRVAELHRAGASIRKIASALDRSPSSISRELKRNTGSPRADYRPDLAEQKRRARRWSGSRLERNAELRDEVLGALSKGWSPAQVAGRLAMVHGQAVIGHESIYRFIYAQMRRTNDGSWRLYLPNAKSKRGRRRKRRSSPALCIKDRTPLSSRPAEADGRAQPGHWEADFMLFSTYGQSVLALHERTSRFTALVRTSTRKAQPTAAHLRRLLEPVPEDLKRSLTFDNGTEFALHYTLGLDTFFCDPHAPWQKGGVENAIGRIRRFLPRTSDLNAIPMDHVQRVAQAYNHTPRKCLDFRTPAEVFSQLLHFEWESTSRHSPG